MSEALNPIDFKDLRKQIMEGWSAVEDVKMMGKMKALVICKSKQNMETLLETRLPLHAWMLENMHKVGQVWGNVLRVSETDEGQFSHFKVLVNTNAGPVIKTWATIEVNNAQFLIFIKEEGGVDAVTEKEGGDKGVTMVDASGANKENEGVDQNGGIRDRLPTRGRTRTWQRAHVIRGSPHVIRKYWRPRSHFKEELTRYTCVYGVVREARQQRGKNWQNSHVIRG
ncbi:hypothetical protein PIB30_039562 [Stylosanthes scabra]|uniref:DUF4283 domain-containing protein n=1 Tax=Stylosanthes scabra TaxID=79078 RepID=A0ABU6UD07_9FABA|nr:hypothetical protein [Stylosanthes scabra]